MGKIVSLTGRTKPKFALRKVETKKKRKDSDPAQLGLFEKESEAKVVRLQNKDKVFDEALMYDLQNNDKAEELYWEAVSRGEHVEDAYCNLGIIQYNAGNRARAIDCFTKSLKNDPRHFESHFNLANLYLDVENLDLAKFHYEIAAEINHEFPNVFYNLGVVYMMEGSFEKAKQSLERYLQLAPENDSAEAKELIVSINQSLSKDS